MNPDREITLAPMHRELPQRVAPHNTEAEQALLGAIMVNSAAYDRVAAFLRPEHFYAPAHQRIYAAIVKTIERGGIADPKTLRSYFEHDEALADIGGADYLGRLAASVVTIINSWSYAETIRDDYLRRQLIEICTDAVNEAYAPDLDRPALELAGSVTAAVDALDAGGSIMTPVTLGEAAAEAERAAERAWRDGYCGTPTGIGAFDDVFGGLSDGDLIVVGARPSMGKTALAFSIACNVARAEIAAAAVKPRHVAFFELEMSALAMGRRYHASAASISVGAQSRPGAEFDILSMQAMGDATRAAKPLPIDIYERAGIGAPDICRAARTAHRRNPLCLIVIDHLTLLRSRERQENRRLELEAATGAFKALAKELGVPVMLLCQLNRAVEGREDKRPGLADLRETGAIEQDADIVTFLYREQYYLELAEPQQTERETGEAFTARNSAYWARRNATAGRAEWIVAKNRQGERKTLQIAFDGPRQLFHELGQSR